MKFSLLIWISTVFFQEVMPGTIMRESTAENREAENKSVTKLNEITKSLNPLKTPSSVQTEYTAQYHQESHCGNKTHSSVTGKQQFIHNDCGDNWNDFAEKCASLIKNLVSSLANAISSNPGDTTNLQLHIKNSFKHFDGSPINSSCLGQAKENLESALPASLVKSDDEISTSLKNSENNKGQNKSSEEPQNSEEIKLHSKENDGGRQNQHSSKNNFGPSKYHFEPSVSESQSSSTKFLKKSSSEQPLFEDPDCVPSESPEKALADKQTLPPLPVEIKQKSKPSGKQNFEPEFHLLENFKKDSTNSSKLDFPSDVPSMSVTTFLPNSKVSSFEDVITNSPTCDENDQGSGSTTLNTQSNKSTITDFLNAPKSNSTQKDPIISHYIQTPKNHESNSQVSDHIFSKTTKNLFLSYTENPLSGNSLNQIYKTTPDLSFFNNDPKNRDKNQDKPHSNNDNINTLQQIKTPHDKDTHQNTKYSPQNIDSSYKHNYHYNTRIPQYTTTLHYSDNSQNSNMPNYNSPYGNDSDFSYNTNIPQESTTQPSIDSSNSRDSPYNTKFSQQTKTPGYSVTHENTDSIYSSDSDSPSDTNIPQQATTASSSDSFISHAFPYNTKLPQQTKTPGYSVTHENTDSIYSSDSDSPCNTNIPQQTTTSYYTEILQNKNTLTPKPTDYSNSQKNLKEKDNFLSNTGKTNLDKNSKELFNTTTSQLPNLNSQNLFSTKAKNEEQQIFDLKPEDPFKSHQQTFEIHKPNGESQHDVPLPKNYTKTVDNDYTEKPTTFQTTSLIPTQSLFAYPLPTQSSISHPLTTFYKTNNEDSLFPKSTTEKNDVSLSNSSKDNNDDEDDDDDDDDDDDECCSCESCTEEKDDSPQAFRKAACKDLEEARRELKAIFEKIRKKLNCGQKTGKICLAPKRCLANQSKQYSMVQSTTRSE